MNDATPRCNCSPCAGAACTCGCQAVAAPTCPATCGCGCQQGKPCGCAKG